MTIMIVINAGHLSNTHHQKRKIAFE